MNKLTEFQEKKNQELQEEYTNKCLEANKTILFDIEKVKDRGYEVREELESLDRHNARVKLEVYEQFYADVEKVKEFLGKDAKAIIIKEYDKEYSLVYTIGINEWKKVHVTYRYGNVDWIDHEAYERINGKDYQKFKKYQIEIWQEQYDVEYHNDFEHMFEDTDVVDMFETAMQDYFTYHTETQEEEVEEELTE